MGKKTFIICYIIAILAVAAFVTGVEKLIWPGDFVKMSFLRLFVTNIPVVVIAEFLNWFFIRRKKGSHV